MRSTLIGKAFLTGRAAMTERQHIMKKIKNILNHTLKNKLKSDEHTRVKSVPCVQEL